MNQILRTASYFNPQNAECMEYILKQIKKTEFMDMKNSMIFVMKLSHFMNGLKYSHDFDWKYHIDCSIQKNLVLKEEDQEAEVLFKILQSAKA